MVYKDDIEKAKERVEAWWHGEILDRPVVQVKAPRQNVSEDGLSSSSPPEKIDTSLWNNEKYWDHFTNPDRVIPRLQKQLSDTYFGGEAFPVMYPVSIGMVAITANYLGCPIRYINSGTTWHDPIIKNLNDLPSFDYDPDNKIWKASQVLLQRAVDESDGYFVGCPDLNGPSEVLSLLRDHQVLAMDFYDSPGYIKSSLVKINQAWFRYWQECTAITQKSQGFFYWMGFWSDKPSIDLQSDFSCMISKEHFNEYFLPSIAQQTEMFERTIYHLDGPGAIGHVDALLNLPKLTGIQWIQGPGDGSVLEYIPLLKKIQDSGKLVSAFCMKSELRELYRNLRPEGTHFIITDCSSPDEANAILQGIEKRRL